MVSAMGQRGGDAKLAQSQTKMTSVGEELLQDSFADLDDEFDQLPKTSVRGKSMRWARAGLLVLSVIFAGGALALCGWQGGLAQDAEAEKTQGGSANVEEVAEKEILEQYDDLSSKLRNNILAEELKAEHRSLPSVAQREIQDALEQVCQELETAVTQECEAARDREYEDSMDAVYDNLFEQLLEAEGVPKRSGGAR